MVRLQSTQSPMAGAGQGVPSRRWAQIRIATVPFPVSLAMIMLTYWTIDIISPALPAIQESLALSAAGASLVWSLLFVGRLLGNIPAAILVDRVGPSFTGAIGSAFLGAGSLLAAITGEIPTLYPGRVLQGFGIALLVNAGLRALVRVKPGQGAALTYFGFAATLGGVFGLQSGGLLTSFLGWRSVFALATSLAAVLLILALVGSRIADRPRALSSPPESEPAATGSSHWRDFVFPLVLYFMVFVNYSLFVALPLYAQRAFGASPETNANLLFAITMVHLVVSFPVGRAIRRWGSDRLLIGGLILATLGMLLVLPAPHPLWTLPALVLYGSGQVAAGNASGDLVLQRGGRSGKAVGLVRMSGDLGLVVGPYLTGAIADWQGYGAPFIALPLLTTIGTFTVVVLDSRARRRLTSGQRSPAAECM